MTSINGSYDKEQLDDYASSLARVASLSNLFSESTTPYLNYRTTEYLYARALDASNLARSDIAIDARRGNIGVGIKTFVYNNKPKYEKIAEFNREVETFDQLGELEKVKKVALLRNERIEFAGRLTGVDTFTYHCIARLPGKLFVFEVPMSTIDIDRIVVTDVKGKNISFTDGIGKYRFSSSKSTLYKEFYSADSIFEKPVTIHDDPFDLLGSLELGGSPIEFGAHAQQRVQKDYVVLPLYGYKPGKVPYVFEGSGLNQWNASGRPRNENEIYIPVPREVHAKEPGFLPPRDQPFDLHFPSGEMMQVKVCQDGSKALMSRRNADLGEWLLRDVLGRKPGELVTYEQLQEVGVDSVEISKIDNKYYIDFKSVGSYEQYLET